MTPLAALRLLAFAALLICTGVLVANIAQTWDTFNPSYWGHYVQQQLARPLTGISLSALALLLARPLARWLSRD
jgi:nitrate reductase alpha subunit